MLLFLDDSYERLGAGYRHVIAGFTIPESGYREFVRQILAVKLRYFVQDRNMTREERETTWETHFVVGEDPADVELKASLLLSSSVLRNAGAKPRAARKIAAEVLNCLAETGGRVYSSASAPPTLRHGIVTQAMLKVLEEVAGANDGIVHICIDSANPNADRSLSRRFAETVFERPALASISPTPFILDTRTSPPLQVADLVAHLVLQRLRPVDERKPLDDLYAQVASMEV